MKNTSPPKLMINSETVEEHQEPNEKNRAECERIRKPDEQQYSMQERDRRQIILETERQLAEPATYEPINEAQFLKFQQQYQNHLASAGLLPFNSQANTRASIISMSSVGSNDGRVDRKYILLVGPPKSGKLAFARGMFTVLFYYDSE